MSKRLGLGAALALSMLFGPGAALAEGPKSTSSDPCTQICSSAQAGCEKGCEEENTKAEVEACKKECPEQKKACEARCPGMMSRAKNGTLGKPPVSKNE